MSDPNLLISFFSVLVAIGSALFTFLIYSSSKESVQKYEVEIEYLKNQIKGHTLFEMKRSIDDINNKCVEWDLGIPNLFDRFREQRLDLQTKRRAVMMIHYINLLFYAYLQKENFDNTYLEFIKAHARSSILFWVRQDLILLEPLKEIVNMIDSTQFLQGADFKQLIKDIIDEVDGNN